VQRCRVRDAVRPRNRKVKIIDVEVHDVEFISDDVLENFIEHHEMVCDLVDALFVESQRFRAARY
jgi:hypothetical protein